MGRRHPEDYPVEGMAYRGKRRDKCLSWVVEAITQQRRFRHLTSAAVRSYLLHLSASGDHDEVVRVDLSGPNPDRPHYLTSKPPFRLRDTYRTTRERCPTCQQATHRRSCSRDILVAPDAPTKRGRRWYARALAFDSSNAMARVGWRLGVSCVVCGDVLFRRRQTDWEERRQSVLGLHEPLCSACGLNEQRDIRAWRREYGWDSKPPEEWLLLKAVERIRKAARRAA